MAHRFSSASLLYLFTALISVNGIAYADMQKPPILGDVSFAKQNPKLVETVDLRPGSRDPKSPESIFATRHSYEERSAKAAYVNSRVIGAYYATIYDPNGRSPYEVDMAMTKAREDALLEMNGTSFRGGFRESLLKDSVETLVGLSTSGKLSVGNTTGLIIERGLDLLSEPGRNPPIGIDIVSSTNAFSLSKMTEDTPLGRQLFQVNKEMFPELNVNQSLANHPDVTRTLIDEENRKAFAELGFDLKQLTKSVKSDQQKIKSEIENKMADQLKEVNGFVAETRIRFQKEKELIDRERDRQATLKKASDIKSTLGIFSAVAALTGDPEAAQFFSKTGQFVSSGIDAVLSLSTFGINPLGSVNAFMSAVLSGLGIFSKTSDIQLEMHKEVMGELRSIKQALSDLGQAMDRRFTSLERTLQVYMRQTWEHLDKQDYFLAQNDSSARFLIDGLAKIQRDTYGSYMLSAGLTWMRLEHDCFPQSRFAKKAMSEDLFRLCRNSIAHFGLYGPSTKSDESLIGYGPDIIEGISRRIDRLYPLPKLEAEVSPNPAAWLAATNLLLDLGKAHPRYAYLLQEKQFDIQGFASPEKLLQAGVYFRSLVQNMLLVSGPGRSLALRRNIIDAIIDQYSSAVRDALKHGESLLKRRITGGINPMIPIDQQLPPTDVSRYSFMVGGIPVCDGDVKYDYKFTVINGGATRDFDPEKQLLNELRKFSHQLNWPAQFLDFVPRSVRFAALGGMGDSFKISTCIRSFQSHVYGSDALGAIGSDIERDTLEVTFEMHADYLVRGEFKHLMISKYKVDFLKDFYLTSDGQNPLLRRWYGEPPSARWGRNYLPENSFANNISKLLEVEFVDLPIFESDFARELSRAKSSLVNDLDSGLESFDRVTKLAREQLAFLLKRGAVVNSEDYETLLATISSPINLPDASEWIRAEIAQGIGRSTLDDLLDKRLAEIQKLLDRVDASGSLEAPGDPFSLRLKELTEMGRFPGPEPLTTPLESPKSLKKDAKKRSLQIPRRRSQ